MHTLTPVTYICVCAIRSLYIRVRTCVGPSLPPIFLFASTHTRRERERERANKPAVIAAIIKSRARELASVSLSRRIFFALSGKACCSRTANFPSLSLSLARQVLCLCTIRVYIYTLFLKTIARACSPSFSRFSYCCCCG